MQAALDWLTQNHDALVKDLADLVAVPSISTPARPTAQTSLRNVTYRPL